MFLIPRLRTFFIILLTVFILAGFFGKLLPQKVLASADWYNSSWSYRKPITINSAKVGAGTENESNFPVLISLSGLSNIKANGADIRFTLINGTTELPREIESYSAGTLDAWVKTDLSYTENTVIYMYYGNSNATEPLADSAYGKNNVWTNSFAGVWHLNETGSGSLGDYKDSTANSNNSTSTTNQPTFSASGKIGGAESFLKSNSTYISVGNKASLSPAQFTISFWVDTEVTTADQWNVFVAKEKWNAPSKGWLFYREITTNDQLIFTEGGMDTPPDTTTTTSPGNGWHHVVGTYSGTTLALWMDGTSIGQKVTTLGDAATVPLYFGSRHGNDGTGNGDYGTSTLDEIKLASAVRTEGWVKTEYNNQNSPSTFASAAGQETYVAPTSSSAPATQTSSSLPSAPTCPKTSPAGTPNLFQIDPLINSATLYFTPVFGSDGYYIRYGTNSDANEYATNFSYSDTSGVVNYTINSLQPGTKYYFTARAGNGCATGNWSNTASVTTKDGYISKSPIANIVSANLTPKPAVKGVKQEAKETGVVLDVKVLATNNKPVAGATVTLHSKVQATKTDVKGIAHFENVEPGEHRVLLSYNGYNGEQKVEIDGSKKEQTLTMQVEMSNGFSSPIVIAVTGLLVAVIIFLLFIVFKKRS